VTDALRPFDPAAELVVIIGPTAAGKSALAMQAASQINGEIISADSRHVFRRMNIGTNKPTQVEQATVPHHLLDVCEPYDSYSLAEYVAQARAAIADIRARDKMPMLVGGTGQYVRAVLQGWQVPNVPPNEALRDQWLQFAQANGTDALYAELLKRDPAATFIDQRNVRRVVRALEVMAVTGQRWSDLQQRQPLPLRTHIEYVNLPREELYARADARVHAMLAQGWLDETRALLDFFAQQDIDAAHALQLPAMSALGYREMAHVILGTLLLDDAIVEIKRATRRFIRMQDAWFRKDTRKKQA
jgi:tRNA dimethylallyltransferase